MVTDDNQASTREVATFCRICEPQCGLVAEVTDGRLVKLRPDRNHPVTEGFACHKGLALPDVHHDPDRLNAPQIRRPDGTWDTVGWDDAMAEIARRLTAVRSRYGDGAVAAYTGNPLATNALGRQHIEQLHNGLGITRRFNSGTQDCANKFVASEAVFGTSLVHPIPDLDHTDLCLIIGENPRASQASFYSVPNVLGRLKRAAGRGARIVFINPRRIETPEDGIGDTIQLRPDSDVWFLAALLHRIEGLGGFDDVVLARHGKRVAAFREFLAQYPPERVAAATGVAPEVIDELAQAWCATPRASVHASTGINMGRQGTLAYWLVHMLSFVTGRLDVEGGNLKSDGFYANARSGVAEPGHMYGDSEFGMLRRGARPGTLLADHVLDLDDPVRALFVWAGNPLLSIAGQDRLAKAFTQLDLLVAVDIYPNATSEYAHVLLPATDMLERDDVNIVNIGTSHRPYAQYTPAVVEAAGDRRPEWWIAHRLLQELGLPSLLDEAEPDPWGKWRHLLKRGSGIDLDALAAPDATERVVVLDPPRPGRFYEDQVHTADGRIDCCPPSFAAALERGEALLAEMTEDVDDGRLRLIHRRDQWMHNSWLANVPRLKRGGRTTNPLAVHPDDAVRLGVEAGDPVTVSNDHGRIEAVVAVDDRMMPGVAAMVHGWGHDVSPRMSVANASPGANPNVLLPSGPGSYEPLSNQAHMTGIPITVEPLAPMAAAD